MPRRDDDNRLMGPPIIELEFEKDILDPHEIIGGEKFRLQMKKERPTLCERCLQVGHPKKFCRREECTIVEGTFASTAKKTHKTGDKKICEEYEIEAKIQYKMI